MHFSKVLTHTALFAASVSALPGQKQASELQAPIDGFGIVIPQWEVQAAPGGAKLILAGTVEQVLAELQVINPNYAEDFDLDFELPSPAVHKRNDFDSAAFACNVTKAMADQSIIVKGSKYLRGVKGKPYHPPGPNTCARVSCSWKSAIWWCNHAQNSRELDSFGVIADGTDHIIQVCKTNGEWIDGQTWHKDKWSVIVGRADC
ncbi:hypothetical protein HER10_EVM0002767 [Colletotrichum scovillei]|uniref:Secreted protein n=1 Tax=Colletotrichum scovillei TaxID=1209932 RepID=A0A9P7QZW5_9PEZI|nr:uncharacterized protein HER10_EVM0002767 [Colletotrichum scovillei]KAF4780808.1 hypothetical protein HER10_EVM0002767 [Colletotrichum scovillei]KAG7045322.1 Secreted protein [Colletotrichum scovillei]KAG7052484.1 Secreted protein [Colletotrichum scovillei]KAG7064774.1 Secreted protein [Colletotrichum scovillei]